jgi:hypothetical protein
MQCDPTMVKGDEISGIARNFRGGDLSPPPKTIEPMTATFASERIKEQEAERNIETFPTGSPDKSIAFATRASRYLHLTDTSQFWF